MSADGEYWLAEECPARAHEVPHEQELERLDDDHPVPDVLLEQHLAFEPFPAGFPTARSERAAQCAERGERCLDAA